MADADEYILAMGLKFAKCGECVLPTDRNLHPNKYELYVRAFDLVIESKLINPCPLDLTPQFTKPRNFLSFALAENCKNEIEIKELIAKAVECMSLPPLPLTSPHDNLVHRQEIFSD